MAAVNSPKTMNVFFRTASNDPAEDAWTSTGG
jgi:hypothetical protein